MPIRLSKSKITSFCGDVLPLHLNFDAAYHQNLKNAEIEWLVEGNAVALRDFAGDDEMSFRNGVLLLLKSVGTAKIIARLEAKEYTCEVTVREMKKASSDDPMNYYVGDLHDHTTHEHDHNRFATRQRDFQSDYIDYVKQENLLDLCVISDHSSTCNDTDFFRGFTEVEKAEPCDVVILPGTEAEAVIREHDRFGILHQNGGEIVTLNAGAYGYPFSWKEFETLWTASPMPVGIFAHPQIIGFSTPGIWDFHFRSINTPEMLRLMRGVEMGNGDERSENLIYEYSYSEALDAGFRVSTTCSSDSHGVHPKKPTPHPWGYHCFPGKTVVMAPEKSKESFLDALLHNRFYATESGNVKLRYTVNGKCAPADLTPCNSYRFHVEVSSFHEDETTAPVRCDVISDGGNTLMSLEKIDFSSFDFELNSDTARYFYLRLVDAKGRRTWSCPTWTGRKHDPFVEVTPTPIDMSGFTATELSSGKDAAAVIDGNPLRNWDAESNAPSILIDMKEPREICALGNYPRTFDRSTYTVNLSHCSYLFTAGIPTEIALSVSLDGEHFEQVAKVRCHSFGNEQLITFPRVKARYVKYDVLSTVGKENSLKGYAESKVGIANISLFA